MTSEERAKLLASLASLTRDISSAEKTLAEMRKREDITYQTLGMKNPRNKRTYRRLDPEKIAEIRMCLVQCFEQAHATGQKWISVRTILFMAHKKIKARDEDLKKQLHEMAQEENGEIEHNNMRGHGSSYRHVPTCQEKGLILR